MLVEKISEDWLVSEYPGLAIGDTVEITDPRELIKKGLVKPVKKSKKNKPKNKSKKIDKQVKKESLKTKITNIFKGKKETK